MEDFSPRQSPRVKDYLLTQTTNASPTRLNTHGSTYSGYGSNFPTDHPSYIELKKDYSKALNTIEILRLEKSNLETALKYSKRTKPGDSLASSLARRSPDRREYRSDHYAEVERRVYDLKQELEEHKKLLADNFLYTETLKREAYSNQNRLHEVEDLQSRNHMLRDEIKSVNRELQIMTNKMAEMEDEREQLLDRISADNQQKFPPRGLYKYVDYIYNSVESLPQSHYANYHFQECFPNNESMEVLIEDKDSNTLILQTFKYLTNLLVSLSSNPNNNNYMPASNSSIIPSTSTRNNKDDSLGLVDKVTPRMNPEMSPLNQSTHNISRNQQQPSQRKDSANVSRSFIKQQQQQIEGEDAVRSPSRLNLTNLSQASKQRSVQNTIKNGHNTQPSFGEQVINKGNISTQNQSQRNASPTNRNNVSITKSNVNRSKVNLDVSQRNNSQIGGGPLNRSGYSRASPKTDRRPSNQRSVLNVQPATAGDVSRLSQNKSVSQNRSRNRTDATPQMLSEQITGVQYERELVERESRLRELDRELAEKERLLQSRENHHERLPTEVGTAGFGTQASTHEEEKLYAYNSNSRYIDHKSVSNSRLAAQQQNLNSKSHISNNQSRNHSMRQEALDRSNMRDNLNQSINGGKVIPTITTITDFDGSPKAGNQTPHTRQDGIRKALSPFVLSSSNLDAVNENDRASRSPTVGKCRLQSRGSLPEDLTPIPSNNRVAFQVYPNNFTENSPNSKLSGWPQTNERLDQSASNRSNIRIRDEYHTSQLLDQPLQRPNEYVDYDRDQDDEHRRKITFEQQNFDDIDEEYPHPNEEFASPDHMSRRAINTALRQKGTEYASFRVSFGRTESKDMRNGSPPPDQKGSLFVFDIPKRKRVSHNEQTYDVVKGKTLNYKLKSEGQQYEANIARSRTGTRTNTCSDVQSVASEKLHSPTSGAIIEGFKEA